MFFKASFKKYATLSSHKLNQLFGKLSKKLVLTIGVISISAAQAATVIPDAPKINAKGFILVDYNTGKVIASENADALLAPASLTKMMTSYIIGQEIKKGNLKETDMVPISKNAWATGSPVLKGSSLMFLEVGKEVSVKELNQGIIIASGNDACIAMAEYIAGSESAFADLMNAYAKELGMENSFFENSHGLHSEAHYTTPRDMATLAAALIRDVPNEYVLYKQKSFTFNNIKQYNRNGLLWDKSLNVDGIKTGHTSEAGYSLVTSATKGNMRLISVVMGTESDRARKVESKKLLTYGFRFYENYSPYKAGESLTKDRVWMGDIKELDLGILTDTLITLPRGQRKNITADFKLDQKLEAPIAKGQVVGKVYLQLNGEDIAEYPLVALQEVKEGGIFSRLIDYIRLNFFN